MHRVIEKLVCYGTFLSGYNNSAQLIFSGAFINTNNSDALSNTESEKISSEILEFLKSRMWSSVGISSIYFLAIKSYIRAIICLPYHKVDMIEDTMKNLYLEVGILIDKYLP